MCQALGVLRTKMTDSGINDSSNSSDGVVSVLPDGRGSRRRRTLRFSSNPKPQSTNSSVITNKSSQNNDSYRTQNRQGSSRSETSSSSTGERRPIKDRSRSSRRRRLRQPTYSPSYPPPESYYAYGASPALLMQHVSPRYYSQPSTTLYPTSSPTSVPYYIPAMSAFPQTPAISPNAHPVTSSNMPPRKASSGEDHGYVTDVSDEETSKVHHIVNISQTHINYVDDDAGSIRNTFPRYPTFRYQEKERSVERYDIVQTRLVPALEDGMSDVAVLTYDDKAVSRQSEIRWM